MKRYASVAGPLGAAVARLPVRVRTLRAWLLVCLVAGCGQPPAAGVRVGVDVDAGTLDPRLMRDTTAYHVVDLLYDGLVRLDAALEPVPGLATHWEHPDPTTWVFHLREGVAFHDGAALTAADVVYTFETILDPELGAPLRSLYQPVTRVTALDDHTVEVTLAAPYAPLLAYLDLGIVSRAAAEAGRDLGTAPAGTGPFRLGRWERGSRIVLEANPAYWGGPPELETVEFVLVPDNTARAQAFEAGDLDIIQSPLSPLDVRRLADDDRFRHDIRAGVAITYLNFNVSRPQLADPRVRRALCMLVDQDAIIGQIYEHTDQPATSVLLPTSWAHAADVAQPAFAPDQARSCSTRRGGATATATASGIRMDGP